MRLFPPAPPRRAAALLLGGLLALPGAALAPALAQSAANPNDQPTAGTLPSGTPTLPRQDPAADRATGDVRAPNTIRPTTAVVSEGRATRTNPLDHLSARYRYSAER